MLYADKIEKMLAGETVYPITCEIDPSWRCNLKCFFCTDNGIVSPTSEMLSLETFSKIISELSEIGVKSITFTGGGEPTVSPFFNEMAKLAFEKGFELGLITNGVLLDKITNPEFFKFIRISLDSYNEMSYWEIKGKHYFEKVVKNISALAEKKVTDVGVSYIVCTKNESGVLIGEDLAKTMGVDYIQFKPIIRNEASSAFPFWALSGDKTISTKRYIATDNLPCTIAGLVGVIGADANLYFCCQHRGDLKFCLGNLKEHSFKELWNNRKDIMPEVSLCKECRYQNYAAGYRKFSNPKYKFLRHHNFL